MRNIEANGDTDLFKWVGHVKPSESASELKVFDYGEYITLDYDDWKSALRSCYPSGDDRHFFLRKGHAKISASMLSEQLGKATALHTRDSPAGTRDSPADTVYRTYPAPPSCSILWQLPTNCVAAAPAVARGR